MGVGSHPKGAGRKETRRQFWPKWRLKWPKLKIVRTRTRYTRVRALNVVTGPRLGSGTNPRRVGIRAGKPRADRAILKRKAAAYQPLPGVGTGPYGSGMCIGGPRRGLPYTHHPKGVVIKKNFDQKYCPNQLNVRLYLTLLNLNLSLIKINIFPKSKRKI